MSRSLTAAARERYAPRALYVLWGSDARSRTAAERFVEAVAGRWERSSLDLEEQLEARLPGLSWSERSPVRGRPRGPRARRAVAGSTPESGLEEVPVGPEDEVPASSPDRHHAEPSEMDRGARSMRASSPGSRIAARGREESPTQSEGAVSIPGSPAPAVPPASPRRRDRTRSAGHRHRAGAGSAAHGASSRWRDATDASAWTSALSGDRARWWDPADDPDEPDRRRFEQWSLERRWRDAALEEWRKWEF